MVNHGSVDDDLLSLLIYSTNSEFKNSEFVKHASSAPVHKQPGKAKYNIMVILEIVGHLN